MNKILAVARAEYFIAVTSKAFLIGLLMMPVFMGGAFVVQYMTRDQIDVTPRKIAIVDNTGRLLKAIQGHAEQHNQNQVFVLDDDGNRKQVQAEFIVEAASKTAAETTPSSDQQPSDGEAIADGSGQNWSNIQNGPDGERLDVTLTKRVKEGDLFAYAIIEQGVFEDGESGTIRYHSQSPSYNTLPNWLQQVVNMEVKLAQSKALGLSPQDVASLSREVPLQTFGLLTMNSDGQVTDAKEENRALTFIVPFAGLMLMFMMIMSVAPAMLNNVLEEKMQKISEFLVSSITPFQLMLGKLTGAVAIGLTLSVIYIAAAYGMSVYFEIADRIPLSLYAWFFFFLLIGLVIFGSVFSAVGAACSEIKDAQSLMAPVMMLVIVPMMCMGPVLDSPSSNFSILVSLFPPATPMLMFARMAIQPGPAMWEVVLAVILSSLFAVACVWAAGKVFRVGILSQGQAPGFAQLAKWVMTK